MNAPPDDPQPLTTALSTLVARVAVLERWMRRSQRTQIALLALVFFALVVCLVVFSTG